ncbi:MAG: carbamoyltransferase HypF, partial [Candidatus Eremiobacteraeota bacterium]|nr:carbamoyltransferase HypF [Candidatus Eremiobacteraeota bacterium]
MAIEAKRVRVRGVVQGVGFRPFVYRLARDGGLAGWILNAESGVEIHVEGQTEAIDGFVRSIEAQPPPAARIAELAVARADFQGFTQFVIRESAKQGVPTVRVSPDLPVCAACLRELFDPADRRYSYPYINCTECGPRFTIIRELPYDRERTTMAAWPMCGECFAEYHNPLDRRFHAQPVACPACGPQFHLQIDGRTMPAADSIAQTVQLLRGGKILAVKGLGGYHLACDARNAAAVFALRERKFRKERPFALMVSSLEVAKKLVELSPEAEALLVSVQRPIVLAPARTSLDGIAPDNRELGVMLPYTPLHHLLFHAGAPDTLVMTSANRSSEPIAYRDSDALNRLSGIADAFLIGEREIARRVDDSVARAGSFGSAVLRHARGYAPEAVASLPVTQPILALGADLKNSITLVVEGQAFVSQHIGDLNHFQAFEAFKETINDLCAMYEVRPDDLLVAHDLHPEYASTTRALVMPGRHVAVQHHRAHVASVLAERREWESSVLGVAFDGTGFGDDGTIWGGEFFCGSLRDGFARVASLRPAQLAGGDAAARFPVQAAAGFLCQLSQAPDFCAPPFCFPQRYRQTQALLARNVRVFQTTSVGRLFDAAAALLGFTREISFEGQAAMWLEHVAAGSGPVAPYPFPLQGTELDFRPMLEALIADRMGGRDISE